MKLLFILTIALFIGATIGYNWIMLSKELSFNIPEVKAQELEKELSVKDYVLNAVKEAGLDPYEAYVIINCESRWNSDVVVREPNKTTSLGLWQINTIHKNISNADKLDYKKATDWAIAKRLKDKSWKAWTCSNKLQLVAPASSEAEDN